MNWIAFLFALEIGMANQLNQQFTPGEAIYIQLETQMTLIEIFKTDFTSRAYMGPIRPEPYAPWHQDYEVQIYAKYRGFSTGWRHICRHPVIAEVLPDIEDLLGGGNVLFVRYETRRRGRDE